MFIVYCFHPDAGFTDSVKAHDASLPKADGNGDKKDLDSKPADGIVTPASAASVPGMQSMLFERDMPCGRMDC